VKSYKIVIKNLPEINEGFLEKGKKTDHSPRKYIGAAITATSDSNSSDATDKIALHNIDAIRLDTIS